MLKILGRTAAHVAVGFSVAWAAVFGDGRLRIAAIVVGILILLWPLFVSDEVWAGRIVLRTGRFLGGAIAEGWELISNEFSFRERLWATGILCSVVVSALLYEPEAQPQSRIFQSVSVLGAVMLWVAVLYGAIGLWRKKL